MPERHGLLLWKEKLTVSVIYSLIFRFFKHLLFLCSFNNLGCLIYFPTELHESIIWTWIWNPCQIWIANIFFSLHMLPFHFIDGFFYYAECFEFDVVSLVYFCSSCLCVWWLSCLSCLYFGKQSFISCFICYYLLPFLPKETDWLNGYKNKTYIYAVYKRPTTVPGTHTDWKWVDGKRYSMQMEIKRKPDWQFSYQKK